MNAEDFLGDGVTATTSVPWRVLVRTLGGATVVLDAVKQEWAIPPGAVERITLGFDQPSFGDEQILARLALVAKLVTQTVLVVHVPCPS